ncbi:hypothetical protein ACFQH9_17375 [Pseudonocardia lutea]|jgi:hypothetical protein|uniref:Uncharacterized protein n=1 Tax=Pseudonocardia lutea TaxID=2172015 RepID=A0ABW1I8M1_9PSEU
MTIRLVTGPPRLTGTAAELAPPDRSRFRAAAHHARRVYPGCVGELLHRELTAFAEFGHRFDRDGLVPRLATEILARPLRDADGHQPGA